MGYLIQLEAYQGPFDLLLDLIAQNEIDIWDIPIAKITEQYLEYLYSLQERDLAIAGEFLVMAATLIRIKSRLLLPPEPSSEEESEEEEVDPRLELVDQLLRYKFYKDVAEFLRGRYEQTAGVFTKGQPIGRIDLRPIFPNPVGKLTVHDLFKIYHELITEVAEAETVPSLPARISVQERLGLIRLQLVGQPRLSFHQLLRDQTPGEIVVTFLAVLELVRLGEVLVIQDQSFGEINVKPYALELEVLA